MAFDKTESWDPFEPSDGNAGQGRSASHYASAQMLETYVEHQQTMLPRERHALAQQIKQAVKDEEANRVIPLPRLCQRYLESQNEMGPFARRVLGGSICEAAENFRKL